MLQEGRDLRDVLLQHPLLPPPLLRCSSFRWGGFWIRTAKAHIGCPRDLVSLCRHHVGPIKGPPWTPHYGAAVMYGGSQGALNWAPVMPRDARLSASCVWLLLFFLSGVSAADKFQELFDQTKFGLYLYFSYWFVAELNFDCWEFNLKIVIAIIS